MALVDTAVLWNQMENPALVSQVGPNGVVIGNPTFPAGVWGNAIHCGDTGLDGNVFAAAHPVGDTMMDFHWKPDNNSGASPNVQYIYDAFNGVNDFYSITQDFAAGKTFSIWARQTGIAKVQYDYNFAFSGGTWYHVSVRFSSSLGAKQRVALWIDGAPKVPAVYTRDLAYVFGGGPLASYIGVHRALIRGRQAIDNPKIYNSYAFLADALANRNNEGWPPTGGKRMIDGGVRSNMIDGSVLVN